MWTNRLTPPQRDRVLALAARATAADAIAPLNEEARFALAGDAARHLLHSDPATGQLVGYLQWQPGYRTAQLVVDPGHRRRGIGSRLLHELMAAEPSWGVWAFGDTPAAQGFAAAHRLGGARGLLIMATELETPPVVAAVPGLSLRPFAADDAAAVLAVNAEAFAHHAEQGALDAAGLAARMAEPWFDPEGLILGFDDTGLAGFHWTKRVDARTGEVYVMAVAPRAQGRGYGRVLLQAGLAHLGQRGADRVLLYVDAADQVAVRMYESAGFRVAHRDLLYAPEPQEKP